MVVSISVGAYLHAIKDEATFINVTLGGELNFFCVKIDGKLNQSALVKSKEV